MHLMRQEKLWLVKYQVKASAIAPWRNFEAEEVELGLLSFESGPSYVPAVDRTKGFNVGTVVILEGKEYLAGYGPHPSHKV